MNNLPNRFWEKVEYSPGCWTWSAAKTRAGYGRFQVSGKAKLAHRLVLGEPEGMVLHTCDNPSCVNPQHLYVGDHAQNMRDKMSRGRQPRGEKHGRAILSAVDVVDIRASKDSRKALADRFGVSPHTIKAVRRGTNWTHI